jgi:hypothetical protein
MWSAGTGYDIYGLTLAAATVIPLQVGVYTSLLALKCLMLILQPIVISAQGFFNDIKIV